MVRSSKNFEGVNRHGLPQYFTKNVQRFRGGLVFKAHRFCASLNSRLESNEEGRHTRLGTRPATNTETLQPVFGIESNLGFKATFGSTTILHAPTDAVRTAKGGRSCPKLRQEVVNGAPFKLNTWRRFSAAKCGVQVFRFPVRGAGFKV